MRTIGYLVFAAWLALMGVGKIYSAEIDTFTYPKELLNNVEFKKVWDIHQTRIQSLITDCMVILEVNKKSATEKGDLDKVTLIEAEIIDVNKNVGAGYIATSTRDFKKYPNLALAQKNYNAIVKQHNDNFIKMLEKLVSDLTKAKDLDNAKIVKKFVEEMKLEEVKRVIVGEWKKTDKSASLRKFNNDGTMNNGNGKWFIKDNQLCMQIDNNVMIHYLLPVKLINWEPTDKKLTDHVMTKIY